MSGKRSDKFRYPPRQHSALFSFFSEFMRTSIVDAHIQMRRAADEAWKRPAIATDSAAHASEVEPVALFGEFRCAFGIDRDIRHQRAPDCFLASAENCATH